MFWQELLERVDTPPGPSHFGEAVQEAEAEVVQAERRVVEALPRLGRSEADLKARRKGEPRKVDLVLKSAFSLQSFSVSDMLPTRKQ